MLTAVPARVSIPAISPDGEGHGAIFPPIDAELGAVLAGLLADDEVATTARRVARLLARGEFPAPASSAYPVIPWPPF